MPAPEGIKRIGDALWVPVRVFATEDALAEATELAGLSRLTPTHLGNVER